VWGQKAPSKHENGGKKRPQNHKVGAESAPAQIRAEKSVGAKSAVKMQKWGQKAPSKQQSDGKKRHYISNCGGTLTTTYHIQGAGAPAKTENYVNADAFIFFREKVRPFPHLARNASTTLRKDGNFNGTDKKKWI